MDTDWEKKLATKTHKAQKEKATEKEKFVGLSVCSVWSVVFVGTTEYTEYTEGRARRRDYPGSAVSFFVCFLASLGSLNQISVHQCSSVVLSRAQICQLPQF
jgi:hypothetical protein